MKTKLLVLVIHLLLSLFWISCKNSVAIKATSIYTKQVCTSYYYDLLQKRVYTRMEIEPEFPGGMSEYARFMNRHVRCTEEMIEADDRQSSIGFTFIVDTDGQIKYPAFHGTVDTTDFTPLEKEIYRALKLMPKWPPGMCNGKMVAAEVKRSMAVSLSKE